MDFSSPVTTALIQNITSVAPVNLPKEVKCEICNILVSSYVVLKDHISGRKHKHQFKLYSRARKNKILKCDVCAFVSKDHNDYEAHVTSEAHVEKVKIFKPQQSVEIPPPVQPVNPQTVPKMPVPQALLNIPSLLPQDEIIEIQKTMHDKLNEKALRQILAKDKKEWNCANCNVTCQSIQSWQAHLASKKHRKNKHKFRVFPGISKEFVKRKYQTSFVRAAETIGNEFIEDGVIFYCKRCDVRMQTKVQLEVHMSSNQHKLNHPITPVPVEGSYTYSAPTYNAPTMNPQLFNFENSSYGYGFRNWTGENFIFNKDYVPPSQAELQKQQEMERQRLLVEEAKTKLLARFPFYAINSQAAPVNPAEIPVPPEGPPQFNFAED